MTDFSKLSHAYGKAGDVPRLLRDLRSSNAKVRGKALFQLGASICHQGSFYSATPPAVAELVRLLDEPKVGGKDGVLKLLADVATLDEPEQFALSGFDTKKNAHLLRGVWKRAVDEVNAGAEVVRAQLRAKEPAVRAMAAYLLSWLDREASRSLPAVQAALQTERHPAVRASLVLAQGYLARATKVKLTALPGTDRDALVRTAAALAAFIANGESKDVLVALGAAAGSKALARTALPWLGGDLAFFAVRALLNAKDRASTTGPLLAALERGVEPAAPELVRRLFPVAKAPKMRAPKKKKGELVRHDLVANAALHAFTLTPKGLSADQRRVLTAVARFESIDAELGTALGERGLPATLELLQRWLSGKLDTPSVLDRRIGATTVAGLFGAAVKAKADQRAKLVQALVKGLSGDDAFDAAWAALVNLEHDDLQEVALDVAWAAGPRAEKSVRAAIERLEREGPPKREDPARDSIIHFIGCFVLVGVALAAKALAKKRPAEPLVDRYLQRQYGFQPRVRDALAALPVARRAAWVLAKGRDNQPQPTEHFHGAWPYFLAVPTPTITRRVLTHVSKWKPKDNWGAPRKKWADRHLVAYIEALRATKQDARACEQALAKLG